MRSNASVCVGPSGFYVTAAGLDAKPYPHQPPTPGFKVHKNCVPYTKGGEWVQPPGAIHPRPDLLGVFCPRPHSEDRIPTYAWVSFRLRESLGPKVNGQALIICINTVVATPHPATPGCRQNCLFDKMRTKLAVGVATGRGKGENDKSLTA